MESTPEYNELISRLKNCLMDDEQSVSKQLLNLTDNHLVYQMINDCRKFEYSSSRNPDVGYFIDQSYVCFQVTGIRGIAFDIQPNSLSLINAIKWIEEKRHIITRKNYVCYGGIPYLWMEAEEKHLQKVLKYCRENPGKCWSGKRGPWDHSKRRHERIDKLSFYDKSKFQNTQDFESNSSFVRNHQDQISPKYINALKSELKKAENIGKRYANTFITHVQGEEGRKSLTEKQRIVTIDAITECHHSLWRCFNSIAGDLLDTGTGSTYSKVYDTSKFLNNPWVRKEDLEAYHNGNAERAIRLESECSKYLEEW